MPKLYREFLKQLQTELENNISLYNTNLDTVDDTGTEIENEVLSNNGVDTIIDTEQDKNIDYNTNNNIPNLFFNNNQKGKSDQKRKEQEKNIEFREKPSENLVSIVENLIENKTLYKLDSNRLSEDFKNIYFSKVENHQENLLIFIYCLKNILFAIKSYHEIIWWFDWFLLPNFGCVNFKKSVLFAFRDLCGQFLVLDIGVSSLNLNLNKGSNLNSNASSAVNLNSTSSTNSSTSPLHCILIAKLLNLYSNTAKAKPYTTTTNVSYNDHQKIIMANIESVFAQYINKQPVTLFNMIDSFFIKKETRFQMLGLLSAIVSLQSPHLYEIHQTDLLKHILNCIILDNSVALVSSAVTVLTMIMPHICYTLGSYLPTLFHAYYRVVCWDLIVKVDNNNNNIIDRNSNNNNNNNNLENLSELDIAEKLVSFVSDSTLMDLTSSGELTSNLKNHLLSSIKTDQFSNTKNSDLKNSDTNDSTLNNELNNLSVHDDLSSKIDQDLLAIDANWEVIQPVFTLSYIYKPDWARLFTFIYGMFPLNLIKFIREPLKYFEEHNHPIPKFSEYTLSDLKLRTKSVSTLHLIHPLILTATPESELDPGRWKSAGSPEEIAADCISYDTERFLSMDKLASEILHEEVSPYTESPSLCSSNDKSKVILSNNMIQNNSSRTISISSSGQGDQNNSNLDINALNLNPINKEVLNTALRSSIHSSQNNEHSLKDPQSIISSPSPSSPDVERNTNNLINSKSPLSLAMYHKSLLSTPKSSISTPISMAPITPLLLGNSKSEVNSLISPLSKNPDDSELDTNNCKSSAGTTDWQNSNLRMSPVNTDVPESIINKLKGNPEEKENTSNNNNVFVSASSKISNKKARTFSIGSDNSNNSNNNDNLIGNNNVDLILSDVQKIIALYSREIYLLKNELNFQNYLKQLHILQIRRLKEKHIHEARDNSLMQSLIIQGKNLKSRINRLENEIHRQRELNQVFKSDRSKYEQQLISKNRELRTDNERIKNEMIETLRNKNELSESSKGLELSMKELKKNHTELKHKLTIMQEQIKDYESDVKARGEEHSKNNDTKEKMNILENKIKNMIIDNEKLTISLKTSKQEYEELKILSTKKIQNLEKLFSEKENNINNSQKNAALLYEIKTTLGGRITELQKSQAKVLSKYQEMQNKYTKLLSHLSDSKDKLSINSFDNFDLNKSSTSSNIGSFEYLSNNPIHPGFNNSGEALKNERNNDYYSFGPNSNPRKSKSASNIKGQNNLIPRLGMTTDMSKNRR